MSSYSRRELHTGSLRPPHRGSPVRERVIIAISAALVVIALVLVLVRRDPEPPPAPPADVRVVTVPVAMPPIAIEKPVEPPAPVERPAPPPPSHPVLVAPAPPPAPPSPPPPTPAAGPPSASELAALYRSVGQTLEPLDREHGDPLRQRYRWIRIGDYLDTADRRAEAARMLEAIASDARGQ